MSLRDGTKKMSKSDESDYSRINIIDEGDLILKKIQKAKTDTVENFYYDKSNRPDLSNLINIMSLLEKKTIKEIESQYQGKNQTGKFKKDLAEIIQKNISQIQDFIKRTNLNDIEEDESEVRKVAEKKITTIKELLNI